MRYLLILMSLFCLQACSSSSTPLTPPGPRFEITEGGIVRGDKHTQSLALIFTGGEHGDGSEHILDTLAEHGIKASFFVTGGYVAVPGYDQYLLRMVREGHYLGPHSHAHLLYAPWENRNISLVSRQQFEEDLKTNIQEIQDYGAADSSPIYFIPPFEWFNSEHSAWAAEMGIRLFNFTPGSGSHRDWIPEDHPRFSTSEELLLGILEYESSQPHGLNGHLLLLHLGSVRQDKMYLQLGALIDELSHRGYEFKRVDELLAPEP